MVTDCGKKKQTLITGEKLKANQGGDKQQQSKKHIMMMVTGVSRP